MTKGSQPTDDGNLLLDKDEISQVTKNYPQANEFIKPMLPFSKLL